MRLSLIGVTAFVTVAQAACSTADAAYEPVSGFSGPNVCYPTNFFQAQDMGQTTQSSLSAACRAKCFSGTLPQKCAAYVGVLNKAGDSNLYTGQCYFYSTANLTPRQCADYPSIIVAERVDNSLACLKSGGSQATAYCSSYISIGTKTVYTKTVTPTASTTVTVSTSTTTYTTTSATATTLATTTITSAAATSYAFTTTVTTTATSYTIVYSGNAQNVKRAAAVNPPACLTTSSVAATRISSACSCLSIASATVKAVSTAPTTTITNTVIGTTVTQPGTTTSTTTQTTFTRTTTSITTLATTTSTYTLTTTATCTQPTGNLVVNGGFETGIPPWTRALDYGSNSVSAHGPGSNSANAFYVTLAKGSNALFAQTFYYQKIAATICPGAQFSVTFDYQYPSDGRLDVVMSYDMNGSSYPNPRYGSVTYIANGQATNGFTSGSFAATVPATKLRPDTYLTFIAEQRQSSTNPSALFVYDNFVVQAIVPT